MAPPSGRMMIWVIGEVTAAARGQQGVDGLVGLSAVRFSERQ